MKEMQFHPVSELFPVMPEKEFATLVADIQQNGLCEPIRVAGGAIVDGRHRYRACLIAQVEPRYVEIDQRADLNALVISLNLHRRHLSESQRAMVAARLANMRQGRRTDLEPSANLPEVSQQEAAHTLGVSERLVRHAKQVQTSGAPELARAVDSGALAVSTAADLAGLPLDAQREVLSRTPEEIRAFAREVGRRIQKAGVVGPSAVRIFDKLAEENALSGPEQYAVVEQLKAESPVLPTPAQARRIALEGEPGLMVLGSDNRYYTAPGDPVENARIERWLVLREGLEPLGTLPFQAAEAFAAIPSYQKQNVTAWLAHAVPFLNQLNILWSQHHAQS